MTRACNLRSEIIHGSILALHGDWEAPRVQLGAVAAAGLRDGWPAKTPDAEQPYT